MMNEIEELKRRLAEVEEHKERWVSQTYSNAKDRDAALAEVKELKAKLDLSRSDLEKAKQVGLRASEAQLNAMDELIALRQTNNFLLQSDRAAQMSKGDLFKIAYEGKPTNAQVEALARAMYESPDPDGDTHEWERLGGWNKDARRLEARAAFAHSGTPKPADNEPNADIVLAGLEERDEPIHTHMLDEYIRGYCEANGTSPSSVSYSRTGFRYALEAMRKMLEPPARPEGMPSVRDLREIGLNAYLMHDQAKRENVGCMVDPMGSAATAILAALRPWLREPTGWELDVTEDEASAAWRQHESPDYKLSMQAVIDLCRSRIRPTFECAECAKNKSERDVMYRDWDDCRNRLCVIRNLCAALEGE